MLALGRYVGSAALPLIAGLVLDRSNLSTGRRLRYVRQIASVALVLSVYLLVSEMDRVSLVTLSRAWPFRGLEYSPGLLGLGLLFVTDVTLTISASVVLVPLALYDRWRRTSALTPEALALRVVRLWLSVAGITAVIVLTIQLPRWGVPFVVRIALVAAAVVAASLVFDELGFALSMRQWGPRETPPQALRDANRQLARLAGIREPEVHYVLSGRVRIANAFAGGLIRPRVAMTSELYQQLESPQWQWVLAHEIAHLRFHHRWLMVGSGALLSALVLSGGEVLIRSSGDLPLWVLFGLVGLLYFTGLRTLPGMLSRRHEDQADREAVRLTGLLHSAGPTAREEADPARLAASALLRVREINDSRDAQGRLSALSATHPRLSARIARLGFALGEQDELVPLDQFQP